MFIKVWCILFSPRGSNPTDNMNKFQSLITQSLTEKHGLILTLLLTHGNKPISEFAPQCMVTGAAVTMLVDRLESLAYVKRVMDKTDRRVKLVSLTPRGRSFAKSLNK